MGNENGSKYISEAESGAQTRPGTKSATETKSTDGGHAVIGSLTTDEVVARDVMEIFELYTCIYTRLRSSRFNNNTSPD
jgi:hypothetical protein